MSDASASLVEVLPDALDNQRIDRVVALITGASRNRASQLLAEGRVLVDGVAPVKPSARVAAGAVVSITDDEPDRVVDGMSVTFIVVHADDDVLVIDKPAGLVVHGGPGVIEATLVDGLLARFGDLGELAQSGIGDPARPGIVHRLDRGTSGLLMVARTEAALTSLTEQLRHRTVERQYQALVLGDLAADSGVIDAPLGRSPRDATRRAVVAGGKPARTRYQVVERLGACTLVHCWLETGRTHQIRAHLAAIGHPVVGDARYGGGAGRLAGIAGRPFLHAETLGFDHPTTGQHLRFTSDLPTDLAAVLAAAGPI